MAQELLSDQQRAPLVSFPGPPPPRDPSSGSSAESEENANVPLIIDMNSLDNYRASEKPISMVAPMSHNDTRTKTENNSASKRRISELHKLESASPLTAKDVTPLVEEESGTQTSMTPMEFSDTNVIIVDGKRVTVVNPDSVQNKLLPYDSIGPNIEAFRQDRIWSRNPLGVVVSILCHVTVVGCVIALACDADVIAPSVLLVLGYVVIIIEAACSPAYSYVSGFMDRETAIDYVEQVRQDVPHVKWKVECYHYENRTYHETVHRSNGSTFQECRYERVKEVTATAEKIFHFSECIDVSGPLAPFKKGWVTRVVFSKNFGFTDENSLDSYRREKENFRNSYKYTDQQMDFSEDVYIGSMVDRITVFLDAGSRGRCMHAPYFWMCTLLLVTWPYRIWFNTNTKVQSFTFVKLLGV